MLIFSDEKCPPLLTWHQEEVKELSPEEKAELSEKKREMIRTSMLMRAYNGQLQLSPLISSLPSVETLTFKRERTRRTGIKRRLK